MTQFTLKKKNVTFFLDVVVIEVYLHAVQLYEMMIFMGANKIFLNLSEKKNQRKKSVLCYPAKVGRQYMEYMWEELSLA